MYLCIYVCMYVSVYLSIHPSIYLSCTLNLPPRSTQLFQCCFSMHVSAKLKFPTVLDSSKYMFTWAHIATKSMYGTNALYAFLAECQPTSQPKQGLASGNETWHGTSAIYKRYMIYKGFSHEKDHFGEISHPRLRTQRRVAKDVAGSRLDGFIAPSWGR